MMGILTSMQEVIIQIIQTYIRYRHPFPIGNLLRILTVTETGTTVKFFTI